MSQTEQTVAERPLARTLNRRQLARLITRVENDPQAAQEILTDYFSQTGQAHIIGITGPPGSGKSTLVNELALTFRAQEKTVGIIAVDPSSPFTGGALLGDRVRMQELAGDRGVFMRSLASRGSLGGLSRATGDVIKLLDAAGYDIILVETVGAGQAEIDIANAAYTTLVIEAPGMGDEVQSIKAGILEIADILVVNKADRPGAQRTVQALRGMLHLGPTGGTRHHGRIALSDESHVSQPDGAWSIPVLETVASEKRGIAELAEQIVAHRAYLEGSGGWEKRQLAQREREIRLLVQTAVGERLARVLTQPAFAEMTAAVARREMTPYAVAERCIAQIFAHSQNGEWHDREEKS